MKKFMDKDFLLTTETSKKLYHDYAEVTPIIDYHCHINPKEIAEDKKFENITQVWLGGDHYKWRQMRSNGVEEKYITGDATDREKLVDCLKISEMEKGYITNVDSGEGLIRVRNSLIPFKNKFPKDTKLYKLMTTKIEETTGEV